MKYRLPSTETLGENSEKSGNIVVDHTALQETTIIPLTGKQEK